MQVELAFTSGDDGRKFLMELPFANKDLCYNTIVLETRLQAMTSGTIRFHSDGRI